MRTRTKGEFSSGLRIAKETAFNGTVTTYNTYHTGLQVGETKETTDVVTPGYRRKIERGDIVNNPLMMRTIKRDNWYSGYKFQRDTGSGGTIRFYEADRLYFSPSNTNSDIGGWDVMDLIKEAGTQAKSRIGQPDIEGIQETLEADQTFRMLDFRLRTMSREVKRLTDNERRFLARNWRRFSSIYGQRASAHTVSAASIFANNWLKWRYGVLPMMSLISDTVVGPSIHSLRETVRGGAHSLLYQNSWSSSQSSTFFTDKFDYQDRVEASVRAGILYSNDFAYMPENLGTHSTNWIPTAWEVTPYSHVADWAYNVGDYLRTVSPKVWVDYLAQWTTLLIRRERTASLTSSWRAPSGYSLVHAASGGHAVVTEWLHRTPQVYTGLVRRSTPVKAPLFRKRVVDAFAMVVQQVLPLASARKALRGL